MFNSTSYGLGLTRLEYDIAKFFNFGTSANTTATATTYAVNLTSSFGLTVKFTGTDLTYGAGKVLTGGDITGLEITRAGKLVYKAVITDMDATDVAEAFAAKSALALLNGQQQVLTDASSGADTLYGYALADALVGGAGDDKLFGNAGNDVLYGGLGNDFLAGGLGADRLYGGSGYDRLSGGLGNDVFLFRALSHIGRGDTRDLIQDFRHGQDKIDLSGIDANRTVAGNNAFSFIGKAAFTGVAGQLHLVAGVLSGDVNGDGVADFELRVQGTTPTLGDLVL